MNDQEEGIMKKIDGLPVRQIVKQKGFKLKQVAENLGIQPSSLSRKLHHQSGQSLTNSDLQRIGQFIGYDFEAVSVRAKSRAMTKERILVKVEASELVVREFWRMSIFEVGQEIASTDGVDMFFKDSDWSEAHLLTQKVCQAVFYG
jgi:transcriptional regulator with XRE-family HTH domain